MKKNHGVLFGLAVIAIAAITLFAGCSNTTSGTTDDSVPWRTEFVPGTDPGDASVKTGNWASGGGDTLTFVSDSDGHYVIVGAGTSAWFLVSKDDKPAGTASTFTVCYVDTEALNNNRKVKVTYTLTEGGQSFGLTDAVEEGSASVAFDAGNFPSGTYTLQP